MMGLPEDGEMVEAAEGIQNGENADEGPLVGPGAAKQARRKRPLEFEKAFLDAMPSAQM